MKLDPEEISIVSNAIGFAFYGEDGRPKTIRDDGIEQIDVDEREGILCKAAAERALTQLAEHRLQSYRPFEDCWGGKMIIALQEAGVVPPYTQRVIIDIAINKFAEMHIVSCPDAEKTEAIVDLISAKLTPAEITDAP